MGTCSIPRQHKGTRRRQRQSKVDQLDGVDVHRAYVIARAYVSVDEFLSMVVVERFCHLRNQAQSFSSQLLFGFSPERALEDRAVDELHDEVGLAFGRRAILQCLRDIRMDHQRADLSLRRFIETLESILKELHLVDIAKLHTHDLILVEPILGNEKITHRPRDSGSEPFEASFDVDFLARRRFVFLEKLVKQTHVTCCR